VVYLLLKRLEGKDATLFRSWINKSEDTVIDIDGERYLIQFVARNEIQDEIESDPELERIIRDAKKDIAEGNLYTTEEILQAIERGEI